MEHLVILFVHFILWLDRLSLKPLRKVVPNLGQLYTDPQTALAAGDVTIGPARRYASATALGLVLAAAVLTGVRFLVLPRLGGPRLAVSLALAAAFLMVCVWLMLRLRQGGSLVLTADRVEFRYRHTIVVCPWALFAVPGRPFRARRDRVFLPLAPEAVPAVEASRQNLPLAHGAAVKTHPFTIKSDTQAALRDLYEVDAAEIAALLLKLGRQLGAGRPGTSWAVQEASAEPEAAPLIELRRDGWVTASLTHLFFPPYCCACGSSTGAVQEFSCVGSGWNPEGRRVRLLVPVCPPCQQVYRQGWRWATVRGLALGIAVAVLLVLGLAATVRQPAPWPLLISAGVAGGGIGAGLGYAVGRRRTPVKLRWRSSDEGSVSLFFRRSEYGEALREVMEAPALARHNPLVDDG